METKKPTSSSSSTSRYGSYDSRCSYSSSTSSSTEHLKPKPSSSSSRAIVKTKPLDVAKTKNKSNSSNITAMMHKLMFNKKSSTASKPKQLVIPNDVIAQDLKKTVRKGNNAADLLQRKLFGKEKKEKEVKALTEMKGNTRTLAMVLRSERELLVANKEQETEIAELKASLEQRNTEIEKLKDLCLKQREEIKALKSAVLFPEEINSQLQDLLEKQGSELKQAKQLIPSLQRQVTSLTGQLQCLAEDLAEVKAESASKGRLQRHGSSPRSPICNHQGFNSLISSQLWINRIGVDTQEFSSDEPTTPNSPDDLFLEDLNPCLTPHYAKTKSKEVGAMGTDYLDEESFHNLESNSLVRRLSKSSDDCQKFNGGSIAASFTRRSDRTKTSYGKRQQLHRLY